MLCSDFARLHAMPQSGALLDYHASRARLKTLKTTAAEVTPETPTVSHAKTAATHKSAEMAKKDRPTKPEIAPSISPATSRPSNPTASPAAKKAASTSLSIEQPTIKKRQQPMPTDRQATTKVHADTNKKTPPSRIPRQAVASTKDTHINSSLDRSGAARATVDKPAAVFNNAATDTQKSSAAYFFVFFIILVAGMIAWLYWPADKAKQTYRSKTVASQVSPEQELEQHSEQYSEQYTYEYSDKRQAEKTVATTEPIPSPASVGDIYIERKEDGLSLIIETSAEALAVSREHISGTGITTSAITTIEVTVNNKTKSRLKSRTFIHTVKRGDNLWNIAKHYINDPWRYRDLVQQNNIDNPDLIYPGEKVKIIFRESK